MSREPQILFGRFPGCSGSSELSPIGAKIGTFRRYRIMWCVGKTDHARYGLMVVYPNLAVDHLVGNILVFKLYGGWVLCSEATEISSLGAAVSLWQRAGGLDGGLRQFLNLVALAELLYHAMTHAIGWTRSFSAQGSIRKSLVEDLILQFICMHICCFCDESYRGFAVRSFEFGQLGLLEILMMLIKTAKLSSLNWLKLL